jgi:hypothetical protein
MGLRIGLRLDWHWTDIGMALDWHWTGPGLALTSIGTALDRHHTVLGMSLDWHWTSIGLCSRTGIGLALDTFETEGMLTAADDWPAIFIKRTPMEKFIK